MTDPSIVIAMDQDCALNNEANWIEACRKDPAAFVWLYDAYIQKVYRYLYSRVNNQQDAEELTSRTFLSALESIPHYQHRGYFSAWLFTIARNKVTDFYRREKRDLVREDVDLSSGSEEILDGVIESERTLKLRSLVHALPEEEQEWLRLRFVAQLPFNEISQLLRKNEEAMKKNIYRLLDRLHQQMED